MTTVADDRGLRWRLISQTAAYALRVVLLLARRDPAAWTSTGEAAATLAIPERYLGRVLNALARDGLLLSTRGAGGGFRLARPAASITIAEVVAPFDAVGAPPECLLRDQRCGAGSPCLAHDGWHAVAGRVREYFATTTVADLIRAPRDGVRS